MINQEKVIELIKNVYDPEIPVDIYELGLIYSIQIDGLDVIIDMTLTSPGCPSAQELPIMVKEAIEVLENVNVHINLVWEPMWTPDRMSEVAKLELDID